MKDETHPIRDETARQLLVDRLRADLVGPMDGAEEKFSDVPTDRYLTGMLFPSKSKAEQIEDDDGSVPADVGSAASSDQGLPFSSAMRPASAGISFAVEAVDDGLAEVVVSVRAGVYVNSGSPDGTIPNWSRREVFHEDTLSLGEIALDEGYQVFSSEEFQIKGMQLYVRAVLTENERILVTLALSNTQSLKVGDADPAEKVFFQVEMAVTAVKGTQFCAKPNTYINSEDEEDASGKLIYRKVDDYVVGHTCAAAWEEENNEVIRLRTEWLPTSKVWKPRETGDAIFDPLIEKQSENPLNSKWLSEAPREALIAGLEDLIEHYETWIRKCSEDGMALKCEELRSQASNHVSVADSAAERMRAGIKMLNEDNDILKAFQMANRALWLQDHWKKERKGSSDDLSWRPFQLAFVLLTLKSASNKEDDARNIMDLLWFPTGGGKTEAYLLLTAHVIFLRRLRARGKPVGAGVTAFMRYTLRLLTIQQFQRAAAMIFACDQIRRGKVEAGITLLPQYFSTDEPISIGLWVGEASVPNKMAGALAALVAEAKGDEPPASPRRLTRCPQCDSVLQWSPDANGKGIEVFCRVEDCGLSHHPLPIYTVDETIYQVLPTLMIGTADKYAQLARNAKTGLLFGIGTNHAPPDLIIQDELHLISGPLGTISGLYEIAIDELCGHHGALPKIIGSTATIRRAEQQIKALFNRKSAQFPPLGLDHENSGFAATDYDDPGRLYVGVTTTGRSAQFTLQAVIASLSQSASSSQIPDDLMDGYWTLVAYFNSLRELGGALTLVRDDVGRSVEQYAERRKNEKIRKLSDPVELTSRVSASEINEILDLLEKKRGEEDSICTVLASNMISVGVDVSRLGVMVVNGQPKTIAEYIQATSRVGRAAVPGLVISICNANKPRDRSRFESFQNWHRTLYREVEASGVTPFAERARDRALHAAFVICARHLIPELRDTPQDVGKHKVELEEIILRIVERARDTEQSSHETAEVEVELREFLDAWIERPDIEKYWDGFKSTLLVSAEDNEANGHATIRQTLPRPTPNSLRSVEASTAFSLRPTKT